MQDTGYGIRDAGCKIQDTGCRMEDLKSNSKPPNGQTGITGSTGSTGWMQDARYKIQDTG